MEMKAPAVIFDRDGTLASVAHVAPTDRDDASWAAFNAALPFDAPIPVVAALLRSIRPNVVRIMTSGRMAGDRPGETFRRVQLVNWIKKHDLPIDILHMRRAGDTRRDSIVKEEMFRKYIDPIYDVRFVVDDRPQVCDMWRSIGLHVLQVKDPGILPPIVGTP
jgi:hypothetical protein